MRNKNRELPCLSRKFSWYQDTIAYKMPNKGVYRWKSSLKIVLVTRNAGWKAFECIYVTFSTIKRKILREEEKVGNQEDNVHLSEEETMDIQINKRKK